MVADDDKSIEAAVARIAATARQRLSDGASVEQLLKAVRPPSPHPEARLRDEGPLGAPWRKAETPLLGLAHLDWKRGSRTTTAFVVNALSLPAPLAVRVAETNVFRKYRLLHAVFGKYEAEYDLFMSADLDRVDEKPVVFNWTGSPFADVLKKSRGDLSAWPEEYLRMFCSLTGSDAGRFAVVDADDALDERAACLPIAADDARSALRIILKRRCSAPELRAVSASGALQYRAFVLYQQVLFRSQLEISHNGRVEMTGDDVLWTAT